MENAEPGRRIVTTEDLFFIFYFAGFNVENQLDPTNEIYYAFYIKKLDKLKDISSNLCDFQFMCILLE